MIGKFWKGLPSSVLSLSVAMIAWTMSMGIARIEQHDFKCQQILKGHQRDADDFIPPPVNSGGKLELFSCPGGVDLDSLQALAPSITTICTSECRHELLLL